MLPDSSWVPRPTGPACTKRRLHACRSSAVSGRRPASGMTRPVGSIARRLPVSNPAATSPALGGDGRHRRGAAQRRGELRRVLHGSGGAGTERRLRAGEHGGHPAQRRQFVPEPVGPVVPTKPARIRRRTRPGDAPAMRAAAPGVHATSIACGAVARIAANVPGARSSCSARMPVMPAASHPARRPAHQVPNAAASATGRVRAGAPCRGSNTSPAAGAANGGGIALELRGDAGERYVDQRSQPVLAAGPCELPEVDLRTLRPERRVQPVQRGGDEPVTVRPWHPGRRQHHRGEAERRRAFQQRPDLGTAERERVDVADTRVICGAGIGRRGGSVDDIHRGVDPRSDAGCKTLRRRGGSRLQSSRTPPVTAW